MSYKYIYDAVTVLEEYPDLIEYIKSFHNSGGFMFANETDTYRKSCSDRLDKLLDSGGVHSGGSWGCMMRGVQQVFSGMVTREYILEKYIEEERSFKEWHDKQSQAQEHVQAKVQAKVQAQVVPKSLTELLAKINAIE
jgi:hypothetical protein